MPFLLNQVRIKPLSQKKKKKKIYIYQPGKVTLAVVRNTSSQAQRLNTRKIHFLACTMNTLVFKGQPSFDLKAQCLIQQTREERKGRWLRRL